MKILQLARRFVNDESGATMVEYGLMVALIAVTCIVGVTAFGMGASGLFQAQGNALVNALSAMGS